MIRINEMTGGRFGNRILHYNSLVQLADHMKTDASCVPWEGYEVFDNLKTYKQSDNHEVGVTWKDVLSDEITPEGGVDIAVGPYCIHNTFYKLTKKDPRNFFRINEKYRKNFSKDKTHVGIHFRGTDILGADGNHGREIHSPRYYMDAIDLVESEFENIHYHICTDDMNFISFLKTVEYLSAGELEYSLGSPDHFEDFSTLAECDVLISSSSTFVVCAGFVGKENKKIIHSMEWMKKNLDHTPWHLKPDPESVRSWQLSFDNFWVDLYNGGNDFYKAWKYV